MGKTLPIIIPKLEGQRFACASCTRCCRDLVVHLFDSDVKKIDQQSWGDELGADPYVQLGRSYVLNKRNDGACLFLSNDDKCMIHAKFGFRAKPLACQLYPFTLRHFEDRWQSGVRFDCPTVVRSHGNPLGSYADDLSRIAKEISPSMPAGRDAVQLQKGVTATRQELRCVIEAMDRWMYGAQGSADGFEHRLRCAAFVTDMLSRAKLAKVREKRLADLVEVLFSGAPMELEGLPAEVASSRSRRLLRLLVFACGETITLQEMRSGPLGKGRLIWRQLCDSRRYRRGRGQVPQRDGRPTNVTYERVATVRPAAGGEAEAIAELLTRYVRSRLQGGTVGGAAYYGWPLFDGLQALWLGVVAISWRARLGTAEAGRDQLACEDVMLATGVIDRAAGRVPALGSASERLRTRYLTSDGGLQRLITTYPLIE